MHHDEADRPSIDISRRRRVSNPTTHHITTRNVYIHTLQSSASIQPGVHHKGIFLELELSRGHGYQSRLPRRLYFPEWTFGVLNVSRANCTNEWREPTYGTAFSNERKRRNEALGFSVFISVYYHSRISLVFSIMHKQILLRENQKMNLGPLEESLHLTLCLTLSHSSHEPTYVPEHSFEKGEIHQHRINKIGMGICLHAMLYDIMPSHEAASVGTSAALSRERVSHQRKRVSGQFPSLRYVLHMYVRVHNILCLHIRHGIPEHLKR
jgi:hypothetical protein